MKINKILVSACFMMTLGISACSFGKSEPKTIDEYLKSNYAYSNKTSQDIANLINTEYHKWSKDVDSYVSPNGTRVTPSTYNFMIQTHSGNMFIINTKSDAGYIATYADPNNGDRVFLEENNERTFLEASGTPEKKYLNVYKYDDGFLFVLDEPLLVFLSKDYKNVYLSEDGTNNFTFYGDKTYKLSDSSEIDKLDKSKFFKIADESFPDLGNKAKMAYVPCKGDAATYYEVIVPNVSPKEVATKLNEANYKVYKTDDYGVFAIDEKDETYEGTDSDNTLCVIMTYIPEIAKLENEPNNYGTKLSIFDYRYRSAYYQTKLSDDAYWTTSENNKLAEIGIELPYSPLGQLKTISTQKDSWDKSTAGRLQMVDCYMIKDEYYLPLLENYAEKLTDFGYVKHVSNLKENATLEEIEAWKKTEDAVYYNLYINEDTGFAIKFGWDVSNGNKILIYTLEDLQAVANETYE